jgi:hypothetical protein
MQHETIHPELFDCGMSMLRQGCLSEALEVFRQLVVDERSDEPLHLSYFGFLTAAVEGNTDAGRELCARAVDPGRFERQVHMNLLQVHEDLDALDTVARVMLDGIRRAQESQDAPYPSLPDPEVAVAPASSA